MRPALRLLPLCILLALPALAGAEDKQPNWGLCPREEVIPAFPEARELPEGLNIVNNDQPTDIEGDLLSGTEDVPEFEGNVSLKRGDQFLGTDKLRYVKDADSYTAEGSIRYQGAGMRMIAQRAEGNTGTDEHKIEDVQYQLLQRRGNGGAERIETKGKVGSLIGSTYSTCPPEERHWQLEARQIDVNTEEGMAVARGAKLRVGKVPVLYLPWFMFPVDERRRTGLLYPGVSNSGRNGFDYRQPIYLNLAPNYDATLTPRLMTKRGMLLGAQFRYLYENGGGTAYGTYMPDDRLRDRDRALFTFNGFHNINPAWQARSNLTWISDTRYFEDFTNSINGLAQFTAYSDLGVYGRGSGWEAGVMADHWQLADHTLTEHVLPFNRLPRGYVRWQREMGRGLVAGVDAEAVRFSHAIFAAGSRVDLKPWVSLPLEGDSWFVRPTAAWRHTSYRLDNRLAAQLGGASPSRSQPIVSVDGGMFFDRELVFRNRAWLQTLEPRLFYLRVPYADQSDMPLFDTQPLTFSWGQLFRDNRYSGADRQADANQLTMALTSRMIRESDGHERWSASVGQIHYFDQSRVRIPGEPFTERGSSAWVADANYAPTDRWSIGASYQWDAKFRRQDLASVRARYLMPDDGVFNLGYRYRRNLLEQVDLSFLYPINPVWSLVGRYYYSMREAKALETLAGVQWDSCCVAVRLVGRRYVHNRAGNLSNSLMLEIELKGLGSAGQDAQRALRRAILGYNRDDLYLVPPDAATRQSPPDNDPIP